MLCSVRDKRRAGFPSDADDLPPREMRRLLRSLKEIIGYELGVEDGSIGRCHDFLFDDRDWVIRYVVVDTRNWLPGRHVLVAPMWFTEIVWSDRKIHTDLTAEQVEESPEYDPRAPVNREYEKRLLRLLRAPGLLGVKGRPCEASDGLFSSFHRNGRTARMGPVGEPDPLDRMRARQSDQRDPEGLRAREAKP